MDDWRSMLINASLMAVLGVALIVAAVALAGRALLHYLIGGYR